MTTRVPNCAEFKDYKTCEKCKEGFYLAENLCVENPKNFIDKCDKYKNSSECSQCLQGFFLETSTTCTAVVAVENCELYNTTLTSSQCVQCKEGMFLEAQNTCSLRKVQIDGCLVLKADGDLCQTC